MPLSLVTTGSSNVAADQALDGEEGVGRVGHRLALGGLADQALAVVQDGDHRGGGARALGVLDHLRRLAVHDGDARIGGAEVDADDLAHERCLVSIKRRARAFGLHRKRRTRAQSPQGFQVRQGFGAPCGRPRPVSGVDMGRGAGVAREPEADPSARADGSLAGRSPVAVDPGRDLRGALGLQADAVASGGQGAAHVALGGLGNVRLGVGLQPVEELRGPWCRRRGGRTSGCGCRPPAPERRRPGGRRRSRRPWRGGARRPDAASSASRSPAARRRSRGPASCWASASFLALPRTA